ncbi:Hypothetical protein (Fragment) [Durusdinium trenchii]|uniref:Uncharacterized protein n=1 Tax=Durusdinium trenchii TaxID=1381693 RepID=A0ABP0K813_9DINO
MAIAWRYEQCCFLLWCQVIYKASRFGNTDFAVAHYAGALQSFCREAARVELMRRLFTDPRFAPPEAAPRTKVATNRRQSRPEERQRQNITVSRLDEKVFVSARNGMKGYEVRFRHQFGR